MNYFIPCKPGDLVYVLYAGLSSTYQIYHEEIWWITIDRNGISFETPHITYGSLGTDIFLTESSAIDYANANNLTLS